MIEFGWQDATSVPVQPAGSRPVAPQPGEIVVAAPPTQARAATGATLTRLLPAGMAAVMIVVTVVAYRSGSPVARNPILAVFPAMMLLSAIVTAVTGRTAGSARMDDDRDDYLAYLSGLRATVTDTAAAQRSALSWAHPDPDALWTLAGSARMWERRPDEPDFGWTRVGVGAVPLAGRLVQPSTDRVGGTDPVTDTALRCFLDTHATVPDVPVAVPLLGAGLVRVRGEPDRARGLLRAMICQLAVLHPPEALLIAVVAESRSRHWDWLKWLPHHQHPSAAAAADGAGADCMTFPDQAAAHAALAGMAGRVVVVVEDAVEPCIGVLGADRTVAGLRLRLSDGELTGCGQGSADAVRPDFLAVIDAEVCARRLADSRPGGRGRAVPGWPELLGIADVTAVDPDALWDSVRPPDRLCVPIGTDAAGNPVRLDIKEAAQQGSGPHGLCIGATGSGKSELLRTVVLGMMARHSPEALNLVLVDFKGGATFLGFRRAEHVAAVITNLADEAVLVDRMRDALTGELTRRQEVLRTTGCADATGYAQARLADASLSALPALLVVVDEFSELLSRHPDFIDVFVAIGRLGRSLGVHLLLASQRLDEGRLRGLEAHLSYRICLKTMSATESRLVLGVPDAHELPTTPGLGYLRTAGGELTGFQAAFVSGACPRTAPVPPAARPAVRLFTAASGGPPGIPAAVRDGRTVLQVMLARLSGHGPPARQVWLPPLAESPALGGLLDGPLNGLLDGILDGQQCELIVPIGIVDRPFEQRRTPLLVDLGGAAGNVAVVGAPQSGKSTALVTLISALAATHDATRVQCYCLDFGGGALGAIRDLPQVGTVAGRGQPDLVRRTVDEMEAILARREALFSEHGIGSMAQYRQLRSAADTADPFGDVFLVIDGWAGLCRDFDRLEAPVVALAGRGLSFGVHVVLTASRWAEVRPGLRDLIGTRIELRLGDAADSELDRRQADRVPRDRPGRGLTHGGLHMLIARPDLDGRQPVRHNDIGAPPIPLLPEVLPRHVLPCPADRLMLGVDERGTGVVTLDFDRQPHLLIIGDTECGKTSTLRLLCRELIRSARPARLLVVDYRRGLLDLIGSEAASQAGAGQPANYAMSAAALAALLPGLLDILARRMPSATVTAAQLRDRSWWSGPELYVLVDDYDLVATAAGSPLTPLLEYLPHARDLGLHLVLARRSGGAARASYEPVLSALRDLGAMGLMMSADSDDGPLIGAVRPRPLPAGRGTLVTRAGGEQLIQVAWSP